MKRQEPLICSRLPESIDTPSYMLGVGSGRDPRRIGAFATVLAAGLFMTSCCTSGYDMARSGLQQAQAKWNRVQQASPFPHPGVLQWYLKNWGPPRGSFSDGNGGSILVYAAPYTCNGTGTYVPIGNSGVYFPPTSSCAAVRESLYFTGDGALYYVRVDIVGCQ